MPPDSLAMIMWKSSLLYFVNICTQSDSSNEIVCRTTTVSQEFHGLLWDQRPDLGSPFLNLVGRVKVFLR